TSNPPAVLVFSWLNPGQIVTRFDNIWSPSTSCSWHGMLLNLHTPGAALPHRQGTASPRHEYRPIATDCGLLS
ncbi:hypothetical protein J6590_082275, partial [Homalodisca vitripennis]